MSRGEYMTVGDLKKALENAPDHLEVYIQCPMTTWSLSWINGGGRMLTDLPVISQKGLPDNSAAKEPVLLFQAECYEDE